MRAAKAYIPLEVILAISGALSFSFNILSSAAPVRARLFMHREVGREKERVRKGLPFCNLDFVTFSAALGVVTQHPTPINWKAFVPTQP